MYDSVSFAKYVYSICKQNNIDDIGNTKLQKLLYIIYGIILAKYDVQIIEETPKVWPYGPVFPRVYKKFDEEIANVNLEDELRNWNLILSNDIRESINTVITQFGKTKAGVLSAWSHMKGSPWSITREIRGGKEDSSAIPNDLIADFFKNHVL